MKTYKTVRGITRFLQQQKAAGKTIGFTPTMGALHEGHLSLISNSQKENDISVVSIFVNPTQFNNATDLKKYPRVLEADAQLLKDHHCDVLFIPSVKQVYPNGSDYKVDLDLKGLDTLMEGAFRPGHFAGVMQVVKRFLDIVQPHCIYMGQKDFQQFSIIGYMIKKLKIKVKLRVVPIKRETSGLAMSSRNRRLKKYQQEEAKIISEVLEQSKAKIANKTPAQIQKWAMRKLKLNENFDPEYFTIADGKTLQNITDFTQHKLIVACTAVWAYGIRLIDNMILKGKV